MADARKNVEDLAAYYREMTIAMREDLAQKNPPNNVDLVDFILTNWDKVEEFEREFYLKKQQQAHSHVEATLALAHSDNRLLSFCPPPAGTEQETPNAKLIITPKEDGTDQVTIEGVIASPTSIAVVVKMAQQLTEQYNQINEIEFEKRNGKTLMNATLDALESLLK